MEGTTISFTNGFGGYVTVSSTDYSVESWNFDYQCEILDTTTVGDNGFQTNIAGCKKGVVSFKTYYDPTKTLLTAFAPGATAAVTFKLGSSGATWVGTVRIGSVKTDNPVKGVVGIEISGETTGSFTAPS